ncbi:hypothetical protein N7486_007474 [Penicillium sp. IBT 16267x]|nr:hypothetical protein N7486_007474 [Penicillium sp. IBT 16267x]
MAAASHKPSAKSKKHTAQASSISQTGPESPTEVNDTEPAYIKELQKSLRNAVKKLNATVKIDTILAEHPGKSLDDLVEEKKINADQKAQALKKPSLQAAVTQIEEQLGHYKQFAAQYEEKIAIQKAALDQQKAALDKIHQEELAAVRANALADATESTSRVLRENLLEIAKFLCAAANMRRAGDETAEGVAFEAVLYQVYAGNQDAVTSMVKLIEGADEQIQGLEGETLDLTYKNVKQASNRYAPIEEPQQYSTASENSPTSDPTIANAGLTELQDTSVSAEVAAQETTTSKPDQVAAPTQTSTTTGANPAADSASLTSASAGMNDSWVEVPRDPAETETGLQATPADTETNAAADTDAKGNSGRPRGRHGRGRGDGSRRGRGGGENRGGDRPRGGRRGGKRGGANGASGDGQ